MKPDPLDIMSGRDFPNILGLLNTQPAIKNIRRTAQLSREEFPVFARKAEPFIAEFSSGENDALRILRDAFGNDIVRIRRGDYANPEIYRSLELVEMPLREYLDECASCDSEKPPYAGYMRFSADVAATLGLRPPSYYDRGAYAPAALWLGPAGSVTPLHKDSSDNFAFQLIGVKRWTLFPIQQIPLLYMRRTDPVPENEFAPSAVDVLRPNLLKFPLFAQAEPIREEIRPGEMLYLPAGWGHFVENLSFSLMVNFWLPNRAIPAFLALKSNSHKKAESSPNI
jgi:hypothetical protein